MDLNLDLEDLEKSVREDFERILSEYKSPLSDTEQTLYLKGFTDGVFLALDAINK